MILIIKVNAIGEFLGYEFHDWIDEQDLSINALYDNRVILSVLKEEHNSYECLTYILQLSNSEVTNLV